MLLKAIFLLTGFIRIIISYYNSINLNNVVHINITLY